MKPAHGALAGLAVAAGIVAWIALGVGTDRERAEPPPELAEDLEEDLGEVGEEDPEAPELGFEDELDAGGDAPERVASAALAPEAAGDSAGTGIAPPAADAAVVAGILHDEATREPLPHYALRFVDAAGRREDLSTDAEGRFATGSPMSGGTLRITPFDDPSHRRAQPEIVVERAVEEGSAPDLELEVPCGPTYRLAIVGAPDLVPTTLVARLRVRSPDDARPIGPERVRAGDPPWVRFPRPPEDYDRCDRLELQSDDGLWSGAAGAATVSGTAPGVLRVELAARGVVEGTVVDAGGAPVHDARVVLEGTAPDGKSIGRRARTGKAGEYRFEHLLPGAGLVKVRTLAHAPGDAAARWIGNAVTRQDFVLAPLPVAGSIRGILDSETGTYEADVRVVLTKTGDSPPLHEVARVDWGTREGRRVGTFAFEDLPAGEYEVSVRDDRWFAWHPQSLRLSPPSEAARFTARDDVAHADFVFRARDAESGASIAPVFAWWNASTPRWLEPDAPLSERFPLGRSFRWRLDRRGYRPAFGDEKSFSVEELAAGRVRRIAEVELRPGWGEVLRVVRRGNGKPISGAKILLDGREAGTTKRDGTCFVTAPDRPEKVEIAYRDWQVAGPVDLRPAWRRKEKRWVDVQAVSARR